MARYPIPPGDRGGVEEACRRLEGWLVAPTVPLWWPGADGEDVLIVDPVDPRPNPEEHLLLVERIREEYRRRAEEARRKRAERSVPRPPGSRRRPHGARGARRATRPGDRRG